MLCGIYSYRDLKNDLECLYVGQSRNIYKRNRAHYRKTKRYNQPIDSIIQKDPKRYILCIEKCCNEQQLNELEAKYIAKLTPKYNCTKGGDYDYHARHSGGNGKYHTFWNTKETHFISLKNQSRNRPFRVYWNGYYICYVEDFKTVEIIHELINWGIENEIK